ncbi:hypothetical protein EP10_002846 [Geobacillus icigianus]|uniref:Uncharacterized protein n=1 Tax=Geobacillus icigianus TaxID=1430331 RepID=A0ABU6BJ48_9BACL|nr:hypothetical protein [Geobacillus icigianus]
MSPFLFSCQFMLANLLIYSRIKEIMKFVEWSKAAKVDEDQPDYRFWLEHPKAKDRLFNYNIWFKENHTMIFDKKQENTGLFLPSMKWN